MPIVYVDTDLKRVQGYLVVSDLSDRLDIEILGGINSELSDAGDIVTPNFGDSIATTYFRTIKVRPFLKITSDYSAFPFNAVNEDIYSFGSIEYGFGFTRIETEGGGTIDSPIPFMTQLITRPVQCFEPFTIPLNYPFGGTGDYIVSFGYTPRAPTPLHMTTPTDAMNPAILTWDTATSISVNLRKNVVATLQYFYTVQLAGGTYNTSTSTWEDVYVSTT